MKRFFAMLLTLAMVFALSACGGKDNPAPSGGSQGGDAPLTREDPSAQSSTPTPDTQTPVSDPTGGYDPGADLQEQIGILNKNNLTTEEIAAIEADAREGGYEVAWAEDGSIIISDGGNTLSFSGGWPDNDLTKLIPKPDSAEVVGVQEGEASCTILLTWTIEDAKAYAQKLIAAGFDQDVEEQDMADMGMYILVCYNADGVQVSVTFTGESNAIVIYGN